MRLRIDDLEVFFPFERMYLEQYQYMRSIKQALDAEGHALLEMPTGTGKTVCLLSLITSYQYANPGAGKLVYCTRTVPEMNAVMEELGTVLAYRAKELGLDQAQLNNIPVSSSGSLKRSNTSISSMDIEDSVSAVKAKQSVQSSTDQHQTEEGGGRINKKRKYKRRNPNLGPIHNQGYGAGGSGSLALCLSSRRNMCIHERVIKESDREAVDSACRSMTASWVQEKARANPGSIETCEYYDNFQAAGEATSIPSGIYDLEELKEWGKGKGWCPYYLTRQAINHANILVFNYQYMVSCRSLFFMLKYRFLTSLLFLDISLYNIFSLTQKLQNSLVKN